MWATPCEKVSPSMFEEQRPRSDCASAQSDQGLRCPQTKSLDTKECFNGKQKPGWDFAHVQDGVNPHILRMFEDTFSHDVANIISLSCSEI